jgi:GxxExxY protein
MVFRSSVETPDALLFGRICTVRLLPQRAKSITTEAQRAQRDPLTREIIGAAIEVHRHLGPGLLESAYRECLCWELQHRGFAVERERALPLVYKGIRVDVGYRLDLTVDERILVELKCVERLATIHTAQLLTYLRLSGLRLGLLMNFNVSRLADGLVRVIL